jgi:hypothetical protein
MKMNHILPTARGAAPSTENEGVTLATFEMKMNHILPTARGAAPSTENEGAA